MALAVQHPLQTNKLINSYLLICWLDSLMVNYKFSTTIQTETKTKGINTKQKIETHCLIHKNIYNNNNNNNNNNKYLLYI